MGPPFPLREPCAERLHRLKSALRSHILSAAPRRLVGGTSRERTSGSRLIDAFQPCARLWAVANNVGLSDRGHVSPPHHSTHHVGRDRELSSSVEITDRRNVVGRARGRDLIEDLVETRRCIPPVHGRHGTPLVPGQHLRLV